MKYLLILIFLNFFPVNVLAASFKLNPHELGTYRGLNLAMDHVLDRFGQTLRAWNTVQSHRQNNANHDHFDVYLQNRCGLYNSVLKLADSWRKMWAKGLPRHKTVIPSRLKTYADATDAVINIGLKYSDRHNCDNLSMSDRNMLMSTLRVAYLERDKYQPSFWSRWSRWKSSLSVQVPGLPVKVEFLEGSVKLKLDFNLAGLKGDFQTGVGYRQRASSHNLTTLIIISENEKVLLDITGREIDLEIPAGRLRTEQTSLIFECNSQCGGLLRQLVS